MTQKGQQPKSYGTRLLQRLFLSGKRIFDMQDAMEAAAKENIPSSQLNKILSSLAKHERIKRLRRGLYTSIGMAPVQEDIHPFVIATHLHLRRGDFLDHFLLKLRYKFSFSYC